jgi:hypothetical protein
MNSVYYILSSQVMNLEHAKELLYYNRVLCYFINTNLYGMERTDWVYEGRIFSADFASSSVKLKY